MLAASSPQAQESDLQVAPAIQTVTVTASTAAYDPRRDDTAARIVVTSEELGRYGDASVVDALKRVPGVTVISTGRGADIRMRGLGAGYTQILVNGERAPAGFSVDALSPSQVERIEVIRSATAEFSTESVAGTINIVLRKVARTAERQLQLGLGGSDLETTSRATWLASDRNGPLSYSLSANARLTGFTRHATIVDTARTPAGSLAGERDSASHEVGRYDIGNVIPRLTWKHADGGTLTSETRFSGSRFHYTADQTTVGRRGDDRFGGDPFLSTRVRNAAFSSDLTWESRPAPDTKLEVKVDVQAASDANDSSRFVRDGAAALSFDTQDIDTRDKGLTSSGKLQWHAAEAHALTGGWEASRLHREQTGTVLNGVGAASAGGTSTDGGDLLRAAAFVQDEWTLRSNWSIYLGVRAERISTRIATGMQADGEADRRTRLATMVWSPIAQMLVKLPGHENDQFRLALTRTFKAPDFTRLIPRRRRYEINGPVNPDMDGNPSLRPEIAGGVDFTYEHYFSKSALVSAGVSSRGIRDYTALQVSQDGAGRWVARPVNVGHARTRGLELEARVPLALLMPAGPAVDLRASFSRNGSRVDAVPGSGNRVAEQVPLQAMLAADHTAGPVTVGGSFALRQGAWTRVTAAQSTFRNTRRDLDLYALWKMRGQSQLRMTLENALAQEDVGATAYGDAAGTTMQTRRVPGRTALRALLETRF